MAATSSRLSFDLICPKPHTRSGSASLTFYTALAVLAKPNAFLLTGTSAAACIYPCETNIYRRATALCTESVMANVDIGRYRRIVQMFWDPEPANDASLDQPVWCLGCSYQLGDIKGSGITKVATKGEGSDSKCQGNQNTSSESPPADSVRVNDLRVPILPPNAPETPPESASSSFSSSLAYEEPGLERGWPQAFMTDFGSKIWMTYRSDFEPIPKSSDLRAAGALSLTMRIKTQLSDQAGFSTDSNWGCMIRSGQSLLANAMAILRLGRGTLTVKTSWMYK